MRVSVSDSPDLREMGLAPEHVHDATVELARHFLALGAILVYGGDLRPGGFTQALIDLAYGYRENRQLVRDEPILENLLAWPVHSGLAFAQLHETLALDNRVVRTILMDLNGRELERSDDSERAAIAPSAEEWSTGLAAMRAAATSMIFARALLGGRTEGYKGTMPGIAQEALLCLEAKKPLFVLGGFGGCARDICESIGLLPPQPRIRNWPARRDFESFDDRRLNNGLSGAENRELAATPHIDEATVPVLRGLARIRSGTNA